MATLLSNMALGSIVKLKESGVAQEFYVARQNAYTTGRTLLVRRYIYGTERMWSGASAYNALYANSAIDTWLTGTYLGLLPADIQAQIAAVSIPYTASISATVSSLSRKVFLLSVTELGYSHTYANVEGTALDIASTLRLAYASNGNVASQWTRTPTKWSDSEGYAYVYVSTQYGSVSYSMPGHSTVACARPAFTLPSSLAVSDDDSVYVNSAPAISYSGSTALGNQTAGFTVQYSVSDADSDAVTVMEKLDGVTKRSYTATLGANQQFQAVLPANFQTVLNGDHTLTLEATDGMDAATAVDITFTKAVYSASVSFDAPLPADDMPTAVRLSITGSIPDDAVWTAEVCNNGNDASPAWEDIKSYILSDYNYVFSNTTKTAENWGINFRITIQRGPSNTGGYIYAIEGGFQ